MKVVAVLMMIIGFLLLSVAGLCTIIFGGMILSEDGSFADIGMILAYSGLPLIIGGVLAWGGLALWRSGRPHSEPRPPETPQSEKRD